MTDNVAIKVENLGKRCRMGQYVGSGAQYKTLRESLTNALSAPFHHLRHSGASALTNTANETNQTNETRYRNSQFGSAIRNSISPEIHDLRRGTWPRLRLT